MLYLNYISYFYFHKYSVSYFNYVLFLSFLRLYWCLNYLCLNIIRFAIIFFLFEFHVYLLFYFSIICLNLFLGGHFGSPNFSSSSPETSHLHGSPSAMHSLAISASTASQRAYKLAHLRPTLVGRHDSTPYMQLSSHKKIASPTRVHASIVRMTSATSRRLSL